MLESKYITNALLKTFEHMGVKIDKWVDNTVYLSIPKIVHDVVDTDGDKVAKKIQELMERDGRYLYGKEFYII